MYYLGLEAFLAIVRHRSFSRAADVLHLTQASVSHRIKTLEQELGAELIDRRRGLRTLSLTSFGEHFVSIAERWDTLLRETSQIKTSGPRLSLSIGSVDTLNAFLLAPLYRALSQHTSPIALSISTHHSEEMYHKVELRELDVAFVLREISVPNVIIEHFFSESMVILRLAAAEPLLPLIPAAALAPEHELFVNWGPPYQVWHDRLWDPFCPDRLRVDTASLIAGLMTQPEQWAIVPYSVASQLRITGRFSIQQLSEPPPQRTCYLISHKYKRVNDLCAIDILKNYAASLILPQINNPAS